MKPKKLFATILVAIICALLVAALINQRRGTTSPEADSTQTNTTSPKMENTQDETNEPLENQEIPGSIRDVLSTNQPLTCTFEQQQEDQKTTSILYTTDSRYRLVIRVQETDSTIHMINDGQSFYTWNDITQTGTQTNFNTILEQQLQIPEDGQEETQSEPFEELEEIEQEQYTFSCSSWEPDESLFSPPAEVTFTDVTL